MKIALITGASSGLGAEACKQLIIEQQFKVIGLGRNQAQLEQMKATFGDAFDFLICDFADLKSLDNVVSFIFKNYKQIDVLINNAAVNLDHREETKQGYEMHFGVNYLAAFYLTYRLLSLLKAAPQGRIINVGATQLATEFLWKDYNLPIDKWKNISAITNAKLAIFMFTKAISRQLMGTNVTANVLDPGLIRTPYHDKSSFIVKLFVWLVGKKPFIVVKENHVWLATSPSLNKVSGNFFSFKKEKKLKGDAIDEEKCKRLWQLSLVLCQIQ
jgi:NAD(P)-dependent dehydrogenase (short-subunit alcohol dehydrogenase family)